MTGVQTCALPICRIAFCGAQLDPRVMQRAEGYRRALREAGLYDPRLEMLSPERSSIALGARLFEEMLQRMPHIDAIFFCNDDIAQGGLLAANRLQVPVPGRIAIAGFNDLAGSDQMVPALTTVRTPRSEVGREGASMLLGMMRGSAGAPGSIQLGYELVVREST